MIRSFIIYKYLTKEYSKVIINFLLIFFCLGFIMNLFEEINFFKDIDIGMYIPIYLSALIVPSLISPILPASINFLANWAPPPKKVSGALPI